MSVSGCLDRPCTPLWELLGLQPHNPALDWQEQLKWSAAMTSFMDSVVSCVGWGSGLFIVLQCFLFVCLFCRCPKTIYWPFLAPASWNTTLNKTLKKAVAHSVPEPAEDSLLSWCKTSVWSINKYSVVVDGLSLPAIWWHLSLPVRDVQHELLLWTAKRTLSTLGEFGLLLTLRCLRFCLLSLSIWSEKCRLKSDSSSGWFTRCSAPPAGKLKAVNKVWPQN